jgi:patatin-like phospholipase/acyl hydrolase
MCLSGGGYRGLYTATLLESLEKEAQKPLAEVFGLIAGTSIRGILAIGLAAGVPAETLRKTFEDAPRYEQLKAIGLDRTDKKASDTLKISPRKLPTRD